ncbi:hypothetical protein PoB_001065000 [Plakobranchus ocellatus]|uniref:Secreted protein n=1 Tax=Plakobranchus ocellatus TaxID=259542 RepID=A0AAV3YNV6_9GAST|nr:hypothetical protein PoB_001065000 [Plakobranchus ocellatus]
MGMLVYCTTLVAAALFSDIHAGAWSSVYCMIRLKIFHIVLPPWSWQPGPAVRGYHSGTFSRNSDKTCKTVSSCSPYRRHTKVAD